MNVTKTKRLAITTFLFLFCRSLSFGAQDVVVVKGHNIKPYNDAIKGFKSVCGCTVVMEMDSSEMEGPAVMREIRKARPGAVFAVGTEALSLVKEIGNVPVIYAMVPNPQSMLPKGKNVSGISMNIPPEKYLSEVHRVLPEVKRVGLVYDTEKTGQYVKRASDAAKSMGITLIAKEVSSPQKAISAISGMQREIELFWMLPDTTVITPETVEFLFFFSFGNNVPVLTFAEKYVYMGAVMSLSVNAFDSGRQAGELGRKILSGGSVKDLPAASAPEKPVLSINLKTAKKMWIALSERIINRSRIVR